MMTPPDHATTQESGRRIGRSARDLDRGRRADPARARIAARHRAGCDPRDPDPAADALSPGHQRLSTRPDGAFDQFTLRFYAQLFTSPYFATSLWNTVLYSIGSAFVAIVLGVTQALIVERTNTPGRQ